MKNGDRIRLLVFLLMGIGGWAQTLKHWADSYTTAGVAGLFLTLGSVLGAAVAVNSDGEMWAKITGSGNQKLP